MSNRLVGDTKSPGSLAPFDAAGRGVVAVGMPPADFQRAPPCSNNVAEGGGGRATDAPAAVAAARRPPWDIARFRPALRVAKLQAPDSVQRKDVRSFPNFQADHFYSENRDMVFVMGGDSQRSELRFLDEWSVRTSSTRRMVGVLTLPTPLRGMKHFTWMQVHGGSKGKKPLLRLSWHDKREQGGKDLRNTMLATVRLNNKSGDAGRFKKIVLGTRPSGRFVADVRVERSRLTVRLNGRKLVDEDVGYWTYSTNYFKAG
eukprot:contig_11106_g2658